MAPSPERIPCSRLRPSLSRSSLLGRDRSCGRGQRRGQSQGRKTQGRPPVAVRPAQGPAPEAPIGKELQAPEPLSLPDVEVADTADDGFFHVSPSTSPASTKTDPDRELDDLSLFLESREAPSPGRAPEDGPPDLSVDVDICLSSCGDGVTVNVNMGGILLNPLKEDDEAFCMSKVDFGVFPMRLTTEGSEETTSIGEVEDVDIFGEDDEEDVEEVEPEPEIFGEMEQCQVVDEAEDFFHGRMDELTMSVATRYISEVIESALHQASGCGDVAALPPAVAVEPLLPSTPASTCATAEAPHGAAPPMRLEAAPPVRPASSRSLISSRSRRRIIGAVVRSQAPAEAADAGFAQAPAAFSKLSDFDPTSPKPSGSSPSRCLQRGRGSKSRPEEKAMTKKKSMTVFRMDVMDEVSPMGATSRSSSLARGYEALGGAEFFCLHDRGEAPASALGETAARPCSGGLEADWGAAVGASTPSTPYSAYMRSGLSRVQSASALALDLGLEQDPSSPRTGTALSGSSKTNARVILRSSSSSSLLVSKSPKKLPGAAMPAIPKRRGLLPELPSSPSSAGSIAWSMRLGKAGARRGGLASSVF